MKKNKQQKKRNKKYTKKYTTDNRIDYSKGGRVSLAHGGKVLELAQEQEQVQEKVQ